MNQFCNVHFCIYQTYYQTILQSDPLNPFLSKGSYSQVNQCFRHVDCCKQPRPDKQKPLTGRCLELQRNCLTFDSLDQGQPITKM